MESMYYCNLNIKSNFGTQKSPQKRSNILKSVSTQPPVHPPPPQKKKFMWWHPEVGISFCFCFFLCIIISLSLQRQRNLNLHYAVNFSQWKKVIKIQNFKRKVQTAPTFVACQTDTPSISGRYTWIFTVSNWLLYIIQL